MNAATKKLRKCCICGDLTSNPPPPYPVCLACEAPIGGVWVEGMDEPRYVPQPTIDAAYLALTPATPEPIRELVLICAGRIA